MLLSMPPLWKRVTRAVLIFGLAGLCAGYLVASRDGTSMLDSSFSSHNVSKCHRRLDRGIGVVSFVELASIMGASKHWISVQTKSSGGGCEGWPSVVDIGGGGLYPKLDFGGRQWRGSPEYWRQLRKTEKLAL